MAKRLKSTTTATQIKRLAKQKRFSKDKRPASKPTTTPAGEQSTVKMTTFYKETEVEDQQVASMPSLCFDAITSTQPNSLVKPQSPLVEPYTNFNGCWEDKPMVDVGMAKKRPQGVLKR
ncbi:hypothetical protein PQX77_017181 [Marasmius sp. AFHP31]|nr:hypothetical protein PQX77_017181 [Marasmius sp. AFHP31]